MNKKSRNLSLLFMSLFIVLATLLTYLSLYKIMTPDSFMKKNQFVKIIALPDLAISTELSYIRHRSLSDVFSIYSVDGSLREYSKSSYAITSFTDE